MKRPRSHVQEDESELLFRGLLPSEWIVRRKDKDYGIDFELEVVEDDTVTGQVLWIQLKSSQASLPIEADTTSYPCPVDFLRYCRGCEVPVLLVLMDIVQKEGYWLHIQDYILRQLPENDRRWSNVSTITVSLPAANSLTRERGQGYPSFCEIAGAPSERRRLLDIYPKILTLRAAWSRVTPYLTEHDEDGYERPEQLHARLKEVQECLAPVVDRANLFSRIAYAEGDKTVPIVDEVAKMHVALSRFVTAVEDDSDRAWAIGYYYSAVIDHAMSAITCGFEFMRRRHDAEFRRTAGEASETALESAPGANSSSPHG